MSEMLSNKGNAAMLAKLAKLLKLRDSDLQQKLPITIQGNIRRARRAHVAAKAQAQDLRTEFLRERAAFMAATHVMSERGATATIEASERSSR
jgi:hypothetical protein